MNHEERKALAQQGMVLLLDMEIDEIKSRNRGKSKRKYTERDTEETDSTEVTSRSVYRARPEGAKARGKTKAEETSSLTREQKMAMLKKIEEELTRPPPQPLIECYKIITRDTSGLTDQQKEWHEQFVQLLLKKLSKEYKNLF